jgi:hypothetical protein
MSRRSGHRFTDKDMRERWLPSQESNLPQLCLTGSRVRLARLRGMLVEHRGNAPRATCLQGMSAPLCVSRWLRNGAQSWFRANLSALSTRRFHQISYLGGGAGGGNRNRVFGVALRGLAFQLRPHGGKRKESNLLPQRDCVYSAATAPAVLIGASRKLAES